MIANAMHVANSEHGIKRP